MTDDEQMRLKAWREALISGVQGQDVELATRALLALTYDDPDRSRVEAVLLGCLSSENDAQVTALAVTCLGHVGRIHRVISPEAVSRLEELLDDPVLSGRAEDALDDIASFVNGS